MFYAIHNHYGNHIQGHEAYFSFTRKDLRDAWVADEEGKREVIDAKTAKRRAKYGMGDGDREAWRVLAFNRVGASATLSHIKYASLLLGDWHESDHWSWVANAPERELIEWAEAVDKNLYPAE